jgi:DNA-directed RNA polymerase specialized sigma24 family protein
MIEQLSDPVTFSTLQRKLTYLAWYKYHIRIGEAEDIVQIAVAAYLQVRHRYWDQKNQFGIFRGIFCKKCLEHIDRSVRAKKKLEKYMKAPKARAANAFLQPEGFGQGNSTVNQLIRGEKGRMILEAIEEMREDAREMFDILIDGQGRKGLIARYDINKNTLDTRLHVFRKELREKLVDKGYFETE